MQVLSCLESVPPETRKDDKLEQSEDLSRNTAAGLFESDGRLLKVFLGCDLPAVDFLEMAKNGAVRSPGPVIGSPKLAGECRRSESMHN